MISLRTNLDSLIAQENLAFNNLLQSKTIRSLTSGYRINSSADDAAGLAVANRYRNQVAELTEGVRNANDGLSQLQIVDGGLSNISRLLDRLKTLATQSASDGFTGDRTALNNEYQQLLSEITRQASNVGLNNGGALNSLTDVYIGGGSVGENGSSVSLDLSGAGNAVDAASLGLTASSMVGSGSGGASFSNNHVTSLNDTNMLFNIGTGGAQTFDVDYVNAGVVTTATISIAGTQSGATGADFVKSVNDALTTAGVTGITAAIGSNGDLQFGGANLLSVVAGTSGPASSSPPVDNGATLLNGSNYQSTGAFVPFVAGSSGPTTETMNLKVGGVAYAITLDSSTSGPTAADTVAHMVASLNLQLQGSGVYATNVDNNVTLQSAKAFTLAETGNSPGAAGGAGSLLGTSQGSISGTPGPMVRVAFTPFTGAATEDVNFSVNGHVYSFTLNSGNAGTGSGLAGLMANSDLGIASISGNIFLWNTAYPWTLTETSYSNGGPAGTGSFFVASPGPITVTPPTVAPASTSDNSRAARAAITDIDRALAALGRVQGVVGTSQNKLSYAISLAQSQIINFSAAEGRVRDVDVAAEAATLTRVQILQQVSIAAMAQANSAPQAMLQLLH